MANTIYAYHNTGYTFTHAPYNNHLCIETPLAIYYISADNQKELWKYTIVTGTDALITTRTQKIQVAWHDRTNSIIYFSDCDNDGVDEHFYPWYITYTTDAITNVFSLDMTEPIAIYDIFNIGTVVAVVFGELDGSRNLVIYEVLPGLPGGYLSLIGDQAWMGIVIGGIYYSFTYDDDFLTVHCYTVDVSTNTITGLDIITNYSIPTSPNLRFIAYDNSDTLYFILKKDADNKNYLCTYTISTDTIADTGSEYNVTLQLDRNTISTAEPECLALEKGFALTLTTSNELKLHQIMRSRSVLAYIGKITLGAGDLGIAITDTYLIVNDSGIIKLWKYEDIMGTCIAECNIDAEERTWTAIDLIWLNQGAMYQDAPDRDQRIQVFGRYSSYTLGAPYYADNTLIAEGLVRTFNLDLEQEVRVESLAQEELNFAPNITSYTNYTGKTSGEVITQLLTDYCKTITAGTIVNGSITWTCPADWSVAGDKSIEVILNELADSENFSWRLRPNCKLDFDAGTVDTQRDFNPSDSYGNQEARLLSQQINQIIVYGGFVNGSQIGPYYANDTNHQLLYGNIVKWSKTYSGIFDATALQTIATNKLAIQGAKPLVFWCERYGTDWGFVQVGETIHLGGWYFGSPDSFWDETVGDSGTDIAWVDSATLPNACTCTIIAELDNHKKVLELHYDGAGSAPYIIHNMTATVATTYEWWWASSDVTRDQRLRFRDASSNNNIFLRIVNSKYYYYDLTVLTEIVGAVPTNNTLDHFKLVFNCATDKFDLYINGVLRVNQGNFNFVTTSITNIHVYNYENAAYSQYISAPSDVADADYNEGDNITEHSRIKVSEKSTQELPVGNYIVNRNKFDAKNNISEIKISDGMLFLEEGSETLPEQNSELIQQIAETVDTIGYPNSPSADHTAEGIKSTFTAGENLVYGDFVYYKSDGKMWKSDADAAATMPIMAICLETILADATGLFLLSGFARDDSWAWATVGGLLYASTDTGAITQTAPAGSGDQVQVVGIAISADIIYLKPDYNISVIP